MVRVKVRVRVYFRVKRPTVFVGLVYIGPEVCEGLQLIDATIITSRYHHCHAAVVSAVGVHSHVSDNRLEYVQGTFFCCKEEEGVSSFIHYTQIGAELVQHLKKILLVRVKGDGGLN